jgi:hypothetical protein
MKRSFAILGVSLVVLAGCAQQEKRPDLDRADYWQRAQTSSALHLQGPKAQQQLHIDIATCTNEIREVRRLERVRAAIPADQVGAGTLDAWETPERDGYLRTEHHQYHDFETCMQYKGWQRTAYLPHDEVNKANRDYVRQQQKRKTGAERDRENVTSVHVKSQDRAPYENLNN